MAKRESLNDEEKSNIYTMLMGPYLDEWRNADGIVENDDVTIAFRLGLDKIRVTGYTSYIIKKRFSYLLRLRTLRTSEANIVKIMIKFDNQIRGFNI